MVSAKVYGLSLTILIFTTCITYGQDTSNSDLAKQAQNPVANLISCRCKTTPISAMDLTMIRRISVYLAVFYQLQPAEQMESDLCAHYNG
jgi:hypothetical protein